MGSINGRVALVTGGASGIGAAIATALLRQGCRVAVTYHRSDPDRLTKGAEASHILAIRADLTVEGDARLAIKQASEHFGGLHILVNNVGDLIERRNLDAIDLTFFRKVMAINIDSMMLVSKLALPYLREAPDGASIINLSSLAGRKGGHAGSLAYATAKGAVLTFTRALASELAPEGIRVNAVAPGFILGTHFHATHTTRQSAEETVARQIPLGRAGNPDDVARAVAFLASEYDGFISGATLDINGAQYMA